MSGHDEAPDLKAPALLLIAALAGFVFSNSESLGSLYEAFLHAKINLTLGSWEAFNKSVLHFINDGLMAVFFLFIGLELKREVQVGELSDIRQTMLPVFAAVGGMVVPALIYASLNFGGPGASGWGVPMATDIAFALGILAVLGSKVPAPLKVMLAAIAIVDDLGAILVIALFYTAELDMTSLIAAFGCLALCFTINRLGVMRVSVYLLIGIPMWYFMLKSGVHATIAGVLLAATIPMAPKHLSRGKLITDIFENDASPLDSPAVFLEKSLVKWIGFVVVPIFAFSNAGVAINSVSFSSVSLGVILGLVFGKPIGIVAFSYLATRLKIAKLPHGCNWFQMLGIGSVAGIGFTMSLFISSLAFSDAALNNEAKLSILIASFIAGLTGVILVIMGTPHSKKKITDNGDNPRRVA